MSPRVQTFRPSKQARPESHSRHAHTTATPFYPEGVQRSGRARSLTTKPNPSSCHAPPGLACPHYGLVATRRVITHQAWSHPALSTIVVEGGSGDGRGLEASRKKRASQARPRQDPPLTPHAQHRAKALYMPQCSPRRATLPPLRTERARSRRDTTYTFSLLRICQGSSQPLSAVAIGSRVMQLAVTTQCNESRLGKPSAKVLFPGSCWLSSYCIVTP